MKLRFNSVFLRVKGILLTFLYVLTLTSCTQRTELHQDYRVFFQKITGTWVLEDGKTFESWEISEDSTFSGVYYYAEGPDTLVFEKLRIVEEGNKVFYEATVAGHNNGEPVRFELILSSLNEIIFTNLMHDFPQKIHYKLVDQDHMKAFVSGKEAGKEKIIEINYSRYMKKKKVTGK